MKAISAITMAFACLFLKTIDAQNLVHSDYSWDEKPEFKFSNIDISEAEIVLSEKTIHEYYFKDNDLLELYTLHKAVFVNSDNAIESNNKQYIPVRSTIESLKEMVRVIKPSGEIVELNNMDIRTYENEEDGSSYRYFAVTGIEKGSIVEILIQQTRVPILTGARVFFQKDIPNYNVSFEVIAPYHLHYDFKSYNNLAEIEQDTAYAEKNHYVLKLDAIVALKKDAQGAYTSNLKFLVYKLNRNTVDNTNDYTSYGEVAQNLHKAIYEGVSKKATKNFKAIIKNAKLTLSRNEEDKIRTLEMFLKEQFKLVKSNDPILKDLDFITENALYSPWGAAYLTANLLKLLEIEHELVITSDRFDIKFDPDFEAYPFLQDIVIYIPSIDSYMAPGWGFLRTGVIPNEIAGNNGLFISEVKVGAFVSAIGQIKKLPETNFLDNQHNLDIEVNLREDPFSPMIHIKTELSGYYAQYIQPVYQYLNEEQKGELLESQLKYIDSEGDFKNIVSTNDRSYHFGQKAMIIEADLKTEKFVESIGDNILFKIGMLIGQQMEMYQDDEGDRTSPIETEYARDYTRVIKVRIPDGYELSGMNSLKMDYQYKDEQGHEMAFISSYEIKEQTLVVKVHEYYKNQLYPIELFSTYRDIINAASDFNKATVVLKKT
jgi:hypothetical protein